MSLQKFESLRIESLSELLIKSAKAIPPDKLDWKPQEGGKSVCEILEHLIGANHMFAALIRGEKLPAKGTQNFSLDPSDGGHRELQRSALVLSEAIAAVRDSELSNERVMPWGEQWKLSKLISAPSSHISYHWGQICYLQTLWGDLKDHY